jgi:hypothetical protein
MEDQELSTADLPAVIQDWLDSQPAVVISIERLDEGRVLVRPLPEVEPQLVARAQVTLSKYYEALMNLT